MLKGKKIIIGVTGSIAAYKIAFLIRELIKKGAEVKIIMTSAAENFISPLTLATLSKHPVIRDMWDESNGSWSNHVELGLWADVMIIAPATANTLAKMAHGLCDNILTSTYLSARCPVAIAPAMDLDMYQHPATKANIEKLISFGHYLIDAEDGELASGLYGKGRMAEPSTIINMIEDVLSPKTSVLNGKKILITSGPTYEAIDPVRFIGNHSSGKMGTALAVAAAENGADVTLISGPSQQVVSHKNINTIKIKSAEEMLQRVAENYDNSDIAVFAAAVADYRPASVAQQKIKKSADRHTIELIRNPDIAKEMGKRKKQNQINVGFALETEKEEEHAKQKLKNKNFDMIVLNSLNDKGAGFSGDTNKVTIFTKDNKSKELGLNSKQKIAGKIIQFIADNFYA